MKILVIGQCTLHWGRMEFGNIGNYYVIEPFFKELHRVFPEAEIFTTFQMSEQFCKDVDISCVPMDEYYGWKDDDLANAYRDYAIANIYNTTKKIVDHTRFVDNVLSSDIVIDYSGDIWGQNADLVGKNRFIIGLLKDRTAQLLGVPTVMLAGSPGPFTENETLPFAREVFANFKFVTNREPISKEVLDSFGFETSKVYSLACPAFIFEQDSQESIKSLIKGTVLDNKMNPVIGFMLCGWNMLKGPFSRTDWKDDEYEVYVDLITTLIKKYNVDVCLMSHSNGFELPPNFKPIHGRDYPMVKQLYNLLIETEVGGKITLLDDIYMPGQAKAIISNFDMVISGRVHGAIAALSQCIPTVIIDYGHEPKAHKLKGFSIVAGCEEFFADPSKKEELISKSCQCWEKRDQVREKLISQRPSIIKQVKKNFDLLKTIV